MEVMNKDMAIPLSNSTKETIKENNNIISDMSNVEHTINPNAVFESIYMSFVNNMKYKTFVLNEPILIPEINELIKTLQAYEMDCHCVIVGQNGSGKSYLMLMFLKDELKEKILTHIMFAKHTVGDITNFILHNVATLLGVDELRQFFDYKKHQSEEQNHLIGMIELGREKRIGMIGCVRDLKKITVNYRNGKVAIVIWIIDRFKDGGSYAAVFVANPLIEGSDRFGFNSLSIGVVDFNEMRSELERLPTFVGYLKIPNINEMLTEEEVKAYKQEKQIAMAYANLKYHVDRYRKKKCEFEELREELIRLSDLIPPEIIEMYIETLPVRRTRKKKKLQEEVKEEVESEEEEKENESPENKVEDEQET